MSTHSPADPQTAKAHLIDSILDIESPWWRIHDAMIKAAQSTAQALNQTPPTAEAEKMATHRATLQALGIEDLQQRHAASKAAKDRKDEAGRFYNQAKAMADYAYWLSLDFWTQDEAIALLLGRNPEVVTWDAVNQTMRPPKKLMGPAPASTPFLQLFERLRHAAQRSEVMTASANLKPLIVAQWGQRMLGAKLPKQLQARLDAVLLASPPITEAHQHPTTEAMQKAPAKPVLVKRKALLALDDIWPTVDSDLRNSIPNKLHEAAKADEYGMWKEHEALEWARRNGKLVNDVRTATADSLASYIHRMVR